MKHYPNISRLNHQAGTGGNGKDIEGIATLVRGRAVLSRRIRFSPVRPLLPPRIDSDFASLSCPERICEALRYHWLCAEYTLSPGGYLRHWTKNALRLGLYLLVPAVLILPVCGVLAWQAVSLSEAFMLVCEQLFAGLIALLKAFVVLLLIGIIITSLLAGKSGRRGG